jgi:cobalamin biosynthesis protein CbiG
MKKVSGTKAQRHKGNTTIFYVTGNGYVLAGKIEKLYPGAEVLKFNSETFADRWTTSGKIICIMAAGIVVRAVAPLIKDKKVDPAVVVLDEKGRFVISLLSGHLGGANELAKEIAGYIGAEAVITTASDVQGKPALDLWAEEKGLYVEDFEKLKKLSARIVNRGMIKVKIDDAVNITAIPEEFIPVEAMEEADVLISHRLVESKALFLRPRSLCVGIGCNRGTPKGEIEDALKAIFRDKGLSYHSVRGLATIDIKKDEEGLLEFARDNGFVIDFFSKDELNEAASAYRIKGSETVMEATGAAAVAEPAAILSARKTSDNSSILVSKEKRGNVTLAIAKAEYTL